MAVTDQATVAGLLPMALPPHQKDSESRPTHERHASLCSGVCGRGSSTSTRLIRLLPGRRLLSGIGYPARCGTDGCSPSFTTPINVEVILPHGYAVHTVAGGHPHKYTAYDWGLPRPDTGQARNRQEPAPVHGDLRQIHTGASHLDYRSTAAPKFNLVVSVRNRVKPSISESRAVEPAS